MSFRRYVSLDPDGMGAGDWLYVVVEAKTGVFYQQQYGGTACRQGANRTAPQPRNHLKNQP